MEKLFFFSSKFINAGGKNLFVKEQGVGGGWGEVRKIPWVLDGARQS